MAFKLPELPYAKDAFEGKLSQRTFEYHHGECHAAYVEKLNALLKDSELKEISDLAKLVKKASGPLFNNASQHFNHSFFWKCLSPNGGGKPKGLILKKIVDNFGSFEAFKEKFADAALSIFGSGWVWLALDSDGKLEILTLLNAGTPITLDKKPLLALDVWEHAYCLDYGNDRKSYVDKFWEIVNWSFVAKNAR